MEFRHKQKAWRAGPPKTQQSYRTIPLTNHAYNILKQLYSQVLERKESELLNATLEYMDRYVHVTDDSMSKAVLQFEKTQQNQNGTVIVQ